MKRRAALAATVALCCIPASAHAASYTDTVLSDNPVDLWLLDTASSPFSSATSSGHLGIYQDTVTPGAPTPLANGSALGLGGGGIGVQSVSPLGDFPIDGLVYWDHSDPGQNPGDPVYGAIFDSTSQNGGAF